MNQITKKVVKRMFVFVILLPLLGLIACPPGQEMTGKATGGGWVPSTGTGKANFGFNVAKCSEESDIRGKVNYHDKSAGVKFNGDIVDFIFCVNMGDCEACPSGQELGEVVIEYKSTNPKKKGEGTAVACVVDRGEGVNELDPGDELRIVVKDGPFAGYENGGYVQGNIQFHHCSCNDGFDNDMDGLVDQEDSSCNNPEAEEL